MNSGHTVTTQSTADHVTITVGGTVIAESRRPVVLDETGLPRRYYLPREDVRMDLLRPTSFHTTCPFKGEASYFTLDLDGTSHDGIVWTYETPIPGAAEIASLLCFYSERVDMTVEPTAA